MIKQNMPQTITIIAEMLLIVAELCKNIGWNTKICYSKMNAKKHIYFMKRGEAYV